jgi:hypothetical protein
LEVLWDEILGFIILGQIPDTVTLIGALLTSGNNTV